jgi:hypothetical protein
MYMLVRVILTTRHLAIGSPERAVLNPVGIALLETIPGCVDAIVGRTIGIRIGGARPVSLVARVPEAVEDFILDFDHGRPVGPIAFELAFEPSDPTA